MWKEESERDESDKKLYAQLQGVIDDVGKGMPFNRAVKANDIGRAAAKMRYYRGDKLLECYREYQLLISEDASDDEDNSEIEDLFEKYELSKAFRDDMELIPDSISVQFYIRINQSQGKFIRDLIELIRNDAASSGSKLNYNAAWLLARVHAGDFGEAMRGQVDIDIGLSDKARSNLNKALDSLMETKQEKFKQGKCTKNENEIKKQEAKIENGARLESNE